MSDPVVRSCVEADVATITLNRPGQLNAITVELGAQLRRALLTLAEEAAVIVVRGSGGTFCAGGDIRELKRLRAQGPTALAELFTTFRAACDTIATLPVPVVCAVEGYATAGGFELMQAADIVLIHEDAVVSDTHTRFGQVPGGGSTQRLPRLVGRQRALAHILTGDRLTAAEALRWGLAYRMYPAAQFEDSVAAFARALAAKDREATARIKQLVHASGHLPLAQGLDLEQRAVLAHLSRANATAAFTRQGAADVR